MVANSITQSCNLFADPPRDILVVDDIPHNLKLLSSILTNHGYKVRCASNGPTALMGIEAQQPDLILLDISMPFMDGFEVCCQIKSNPLTQTIPIIFISALDNVMDKVKAFQVGGCDYITKPFQAAEVLARIENHLMLQSLQRHLQKEQYKYEKLLLNIFPEAVIEKLKEIQGEALASLTFDKIKNTQALIAEQFDDVTILFADIVDFTPFAASLPPIEVVSWLNQVFASFDRLAQHYDLEKIKTIGDAYMVVGGVPRSKPDHAEAVAQMAIAMQAQMTQVDLIPDKGPLQLRIGIHTGAVVAGVIGINKFSYDLWGDAVNVASRMESQGEAGRIQVSAETYERLQHKFSFEERGWIHIKGKGLVPTYWLLF